MFSDVLQTAAAAAVFYITVTDIRDRDVTSLGSRHYPEGDRWLHRKSKA